MAWGFRRRRGGRTRTTNRQRAASRRNITKAQQSRKGVRYPPRPRIRGY